MHADQQGLLRRKPVPALDLHAEVVIHQEVPDRHLSAQQSFIRAIDGPLGRPPGHQPGQAARLTGPSIAQRRLPFPPRCLLVVLLVGTLRSSSWPRAAFRVGLSARSSPPRGQDRRGQRSRATERLIESFGDARQTPRRVVPPYDQLRDRSRAVRSATGSLGGGAGPRRRVAGRCRSQPRRRSRPSSSSRQRRSIARDERSPIA